MSWSNQSLVSALAKAAVVAILLITCIGQRVAFAPTPSPLPSATIRVLEEPPNTAPPPLGTKATDRPPAIQQEEGGAARSSSSKCLTAGKHNDEHSTGNEPIDDEQDARSVAVLPEAAKFFAKETPADRRGFSSRLERASSEKGSPQCYYRVRRLCVKDGALYMVRPHGASTATMNTLWPNTGVTGTSNSGTLRLCNELRPKINLKFFVVDGTADGKPPKGFVDAGPDSSAHVTACWQYYGYHFVQCVATAFIVEAKHGMVSAEGIVAKKRRANNVTMLLYNHAISFPQDAREHYSHQMYLGSALSWDDPGPRATIRSRGVAYRAAPLWPLWSASAANPRDVNEVFKFPVPDATVGAGGHGVCFDRALVGHPNHNAVDGAPRRAHANFVKSLFTAAPSSYGAKRRIVITQRGAGKTQGGRRFLNLDAMVQHLKKAYPDADIATVDWAALPFREQLNVARSADMMIATHGAGNAWMAFMRPRSVFIETWPQCIVRNVYLVMAKQYNVRYYSLCLGLATSAPAGTPEAKYGFLHHSFDVPLPKLARVVADGMSYLDAVDGRC